MLIVADAAVSLPLIWKVASLVIAALPATATLIVVLPPIAPPLLLAIPVENEFALMLAAVTSIVAFPGLVFCTANANDPFELRLPPASTVRLEKTLRFV